MVSAVAYLISGIVVGGWMAIIIIVSGLIGVALMAVSAWITALAMDALGEAAEGKAEAESMAVEVREMRQEMSALKMLLTSDAAMESARQAQVRAEAQAIAKEKAMEEAQRAQLEKAVPAAEVEKVICPVCGSDLNGEKEVCPACAAIFDRAGRARCFACNALLMNGAKSCFKCGQTYHA